MKRMMAPIGMGNITVRGDDGAEFKYYPDANGRFEARDQDVQVLTERGCIEDLRR